MNAKAIREHVTKTMIDCLERDVPPWRQPWDGGISGGLPRNFHSGRHYNGINPLILMLSSQLRGFSSRNWGTAASWTKHVGAIVAAEESASFVILMQFLPVRDKGRPQVDKHGNPITVPFLREYPLFNCDQVRAPTVKELLDANILSLLVGRKAQPTTRTLRKVAKLYLPAKSQPEKRTTDQQIAKLIHEGIEIRLDKYRAESLPQNNDPDFGPAEQFLSAVGVTIKHGGGRAFYRSVTGTIHLPRKSSFESIADYYETAFHEMIHWTQDHIEQKSHDRQYAFNELVAEIGACFLAMEIGIPAAAKMLERSQGYVKAWIAGMGSDPKFVFDASAQASKATDYLLAFLKNKKRSVA